MDNILIVGCDEVLGIELAAQILRSGGDRVVWIIGEAQESVQNALALLVIEQARNSSAECGNNLSDDEIRTRLKIVGVKPNDLGDVRADLEAGLHADEVWCLPGWDEAINGSMRKRSAGDTAAASWFNQVEPAIVNYVEVWQTKHDHALGTAAAAIKEYCASRNIGHRIFALGMLVGDCYVRPELSPGSILGLLHPLDEFLEEIVERLPEFFDFYALRMFVPPQCALNLVPVRSAVELVLRVAGEKDSLSHEYHIASPEDTPVDEFCERVGDIYGISFLVTEDAQALDVIDRLFASRLEKMDLQRHAISGHQVADFSQAKLLVSDDAQRNTIASIRRQQLAARSARDLRVAQLAAGLQCKSVVLSNGELTYFSTRSEGPPVLILNALGQGLDYWYRLIDRLKQQHRVLMWETRGLRPDSASMRLSDQVEDVKAILDEEGYDACLLLGWCTGPQVAMEFYLRYPHAVMGMAFLNSALKLAGRPDLETPYGINIQTLCESISAHPALAPSVMNSLSSPATRGIDLTSDADVEQVAIDVLSLTNIHLRTNVLAPFRTVDTTLRYAAQMLDLSSTETFAKMSEITVPVLIVGCEYDQVAMASKSAEIARHFPGCTHLQLPGATHYAFYDRPASMSRLLLEFFASCRCS